MGRLSLVIPPSLMVLKKKQKETTMLGTSFDPPSDPEGGVRVCLSCDHALEKERLSDEWICTNMRCKSSPRYDFIFDAHETAVEWAKDLLKKDPNDWVILDTETTGLGYADQLVQVAMINGAGDVFMDNVLVKPTILIPFDATRIHGITIETVKDAPIFLDVWPEIAKHMNRKMLIIYNAEYDLRILRQSANAHDIEIHFPCSSLACAMNTYAEWVGEWNDYRGNFRWQKLPGGDHTALGDCLATLELIKDMAAG
jgi:DNA polymerase III epsilon subunit-like protein